MAKPRSELSVILNGLCSNVYFQPPTGYKIKYPCIIYELEKANVRYADNAPYALHDMYRITYITRDPDDQLRNQIVMIPMCAPDRIFVNDNLYHHPFTLYW